MKIENWEVNRKEIINQVIKNQDLFCVKCKVAVLLKSLWLMGNIISPAIVAGIREKSVRIDSNAEREKEKVNPNSAAEICDQKGKSIFTYQIIESPAPITIPNKLRIVNNGFIGLMIMYRVLNIKNKPNPINELNPKSTVQKAISKGYPITIQIE